ncbi:MAG: DEAD/DEAH box helicase, partial [Alcaligenaceae bacterium]|nr:DEAD/DEAH box helicase [Alcaligenaceae bacterium]
MISAYHAKYYAHELTRRHTTDGVDRLSQSLFDASVDLNPHQIEAALFALRNPLQEGVLLADEVGLGKTIEAALVVCQHWAERHRRLLVICPASLRKQWAQELQDKFAVPTSVVDAVALRKQSAGDMLSTLRGLAGKAVVIMSYQFAAKLEAELRAIPWDVVVIDEAHKLRNAHRTSNRTGQALKRALAGRKKLLLTATPLQNSLMELYGLSTLIDEHLFGDETAFRKQFVNSSTGLDELRKRLVSFAKRTLRRDVLEYIKYTERKALTQPFNPTDDEQALYERISAFLQKDDSYALPKRQRHLTALILRKLLASSSHAVAATLVTIRERLQGLLTSGNTESDGSLLIEQLIAEDDLEQDYLEDEASEAEDGLDANPNATVEGDNSNPDFARDAIADEIEELTAFITAAQSLQTDTKAQALLKALTVGFDKMAELRAPRKAIIFTESKRTQEYLHRFLSANGYEG